VVDTSVLAKSNMGRREYFIYFKKKKTGTSLFIYGKLNVVIYMLIYVDDSIVVSSSEEATNVLLKDTCKEFALKDLEELHFFFDI
jgi:hypothetical protein